MTTVEQLALEHNIHTHILPHSRQSLVRWPATDLDQVCPHLRHPPLGPLGIQRDGLSENPSTLEEPMPNRARAVKPVNWQSSSATTRSRCAVVAQPGTFGAATLDNLVICQRLRMLASCHCMVIFSPLYLLEPTLSCGITLLYVPGPPLQIRARIP